MKKIIIVVTTAAFLGTLAPASALTPTSEGMVPLPLLPLAPLMLVMGSKEDKNFKAVNPYDKKVSKRAKKKM